MKSAVKNISFNFRVVSRGLRAIIVPAFFILHSVFFPAYAQGPAWWQARGVVDTNLTFRDYSPLTLGQLKWMAVNARDEMDVYFGAGSNIIAVVSAFSDTNNYCPANLGQLKYVVQPFYDRLYERNLTNTFPADMPGYYPWGNASPTNDYASALIGQAKYVFSFDSAVDSDDDGLSDWLEAKLGTDPYNPDTDGDGISDGWEIEHGYDPLSDDRDDIRESARQKIILHWQLFFGMTPVFTNTPGSEADLIDMRNALIELSGRFYKKD